MSLALILRVRLLRPAARLGWLCLCAAVLTVHAQAPAKEGLKMSWTNNMLTITAPELPGESLKIWYLEAFCRTGSTHRNWRETVIPHSTELLSASPDGRRLELRTRVEPSVEVRHELEAGVDEITFRLVLRNTGAKKVDVDWFQPCIRVEKFTGRDQQSYVERCFIYTGSGLTFLDKTRRTEEAIYRGGQVYVPAGINLNDVNPRPISPDQPANGLIGCISADGQSLLATAWDQTQELFQGVIVCIHNDPRVGGLEPGQNKALLGKLYFMKNDPEALLKRYQTDFPKNR